ncbi:MAG TPA: FecR domain-containing protein [Methylocystis sp.]|nr:FecR domain-containing protein [Methylocystis sp.]
MARRKISHLVQGFVALSLSVATSIALSAETAGTVGSVNNDAKGSPPGAGARVLTVGAGVFDNERIQTDATGTAHIMFLDRSALNVGRNSSVVINHFTYNSSAGAGQQSMTLVRGALRFVGGQVSHSSETKVETPSASIGVRGGNATVVLETNGREVIMVHNGVAIVSNATGSVTVPTGHQLIVIPGAPLGAPEKISLDLLRDASLRLASVGRQTGGALQLPTETEAARNDIGSARASAPGPSVDLPIAGDNLIRGQTTTHTTPILPPPPPPKRRSD